MAQGVKFTIGMDGQQAINQLDLIYKRFNLVTSAGGAMGSKLKTALTFAGIEEGIRRSGEWAQELQKVGGQLGIASQKVEALRYASKASNQDENKAIELMETIHDARKEAIKGNFELVQSFQAVGISIQDLQKMNKEELFSKIMANPNMKEVVEGSPMGNAVEQVAGAGNIPSINQLAKTMDGKSVDEFTTNAEANGDISSQQDHDDLSSMWQEIKQNLTEALKELTPVAKFLLSIALVLTEAIKGIAFFSEALLNANFKSMGNMVVNAAFGLIKDITGLLDLASEKVTGWLKKIPGIGKFITAEPISYTKLVQKEQDKFNEKFGSTKKEITGGEGLGSAIGIAATGGLGGVAKAGASGVLKLAAKAEAMGAGGVAEKLLTVATKLDKAGESKLLNGGRTFNAGEKQIVRDAKAAAMGTALIIGHDKANELTGHTGLNTTGQTTKKFNAPLISAFQSSKFTGESSANLKIGGVFGTGVQAKMVRLSEVQVDLLSQIVRNTNNLGKFGPVTDNKKYAGGS